MAGFLSSWLNRKFLRLGVVVAGIGGLAACAWCCRGLFIHQATAQQSATTSSSTATRSTSAPSGAPSDYTSRVVAYIYNSQPLTRQELGEYLILRHGVEKLPLLLNKKLVDEECARKGVTVTAAEVDATLAEDLKGMGIGQDAFIKTVLSRYKKTLYEWKEDVLRPRIQMTRLVQDRITISESDLRRAYETSYGEKIECRMILWPASQAKQAQEEYTRLRDSEAAFAEKAKQQNNQLASTGGKIKPIARNMMDPVIEAEAFKLQPGQCSTLTQTREGIVMLRCDRRIPADTTVNRESVRANLERGIREQKLQGAMAGLFQVLRDQGKPQPLLTRIDRMPKGPMPSPTQTVAYLNSQPVTREELGEFLIARYGSEKVEFLVNRKIIDHECAQRKIVVTDDEVEEALKGDLKNLNCDLKTFEKDLLGKWGKNIFEWREDVIRARLMLTRLCQDRVKVSDEDIKKGFEAYFGERLECRVILFPPDQQKYALSEYARIRDSEEEFARKAKTQPSATLAANGGKIPVFGRHTLGDENLEREAFKLQPGEVSTLIGTPQGQVVIKCDRRIPPDTSKTIESERERISQEIREKKVQAEMQVVFKQLRDKATPRLILKPAVKVENLAEESKRLLSEVPGVGPMKK